MIHELSSIFLFPCHTDTKIYYSYSPTDRALDFIRKIIFKRSEYKLNTRVSFTKTANDSHTTFSDLIKLRSLIYSSVRIIVTNNPTVKYKKPL